MITEDDLSKVTRLTVVVHGRYGQGLEYETWNLSDVKLMLQDDGRTLKVFSERNTVRDIAPS